MPVAVTKAQCKQGAILSTQAHVVAVRTLKVQSLSREGQLLTKRKLMLRFKQSNGPRVIYFH